MRISADLGDVGRGELMRKRPTKQGVPGVRTWRLRFAGKALENRRLATTVTLFSMQLEFASTSRRARVQLVVPSAVSFLLSGDRPTRTTWNASRLSPRPAVRGERRCSSIK
ncbi:hypothetical protein K0M31_011421 [Melipona bicolor]|uniref:Uncharacterized protein n=1 Tax=Melipona bicolor TaxID=60889 RepID=A0AA40G9H9_9HYME|nr:hypothetical protein K0M31_011421 [Melipona bicolor]